MQEARGELLQRDAGRYPVAFFRSNGAPIESLLPQKNMDARRSCAIATEEHDQHLAIREPSYRIEQNEQLPQDDQRTEQKQTSGWNICMTALKTDDGYPVTHGRLCEYGPVLDSCDCLRDEIIRVFAEDFPNGVTERDYAAVLERLELRKRIHQAEGNPIISASKRAASFGLSCGIFFKRESGFHALIQKRSDQVATYQRGMTVVPSGMSNWRFCSPHEPDGKEKEWWGSYEPHDFRVTILDEYAEEVGSHKKLSENGRREDVLNHPFVQDLLTTYNPPIIYTGLALDLLTLRPEVCFAIIIEDPNWIKNTKIKLAADEFDITPGQITTVLISDMGACLTMMPPESTLPPSAAAFWYGIDTTKDLLGNERGT